MTDRTLNRELAAARGRAATFEGLLAKAWAAVVTRTGQAAADRFAATSTVLVAATNPRWVPPDTEGLFDPAVTEKAASRTRRARERALDAAATLPGVAFDVKAVAPQAFLDRLGLRADQVIAGIRPAVRAAIQQGFEDGLSVADTAALIREEVAALRDWQAAMLARTDLVALANAGNHLAVQQHNAAATAAGERSFTVKTWRTADDERVRDAHQEAEGQTVPVEQPFIVDGERLSWPGDPFGSDENVINCRCVATYHEQTERSQLAASAGEEATMEPTEDLQAATVVVVNETDDTQTDAQTVDVPAQHWQADLAPEGSPTDDGRIMMPGSLTWRQPPLTLLALTENTEAGHLGADSCGSMQQIVKRPLGTAGSPPLEQAMVSATGVFDSGELGQETARMVAEGTLGGVSVDLAVREYAFRDPGTGEMFDPLSMSEEEWLRAFMGGLQFAVLDGVIGAATIVPFAAFGEARIALTASAGELTATLYAPIRLTDVLTACAAGPIAPPADWFANPALAGLTPLTVTAEGRVFGHAATWDCHNGFADRCLRARPSSNGYAQFHTGQLRLAGGDAVRVGRITVKPHAPYLASPDAVSEHYDDASRVAAFVRCYDDAYGIAVAGVTRSDAPAELLRDFLANPPSGDWRGGELLGFSSVPHPGLPVVVPEARLVASADGEADLDVLLLPAVSEADVLFASITGDGPAATDTLARAEIMVLAGSIVGGI